MTLDRNGISWISYLAAVMGIVVLLPSGWTNCADSVAIAPHSLIVQHSSGLLPAVAFGAARSVAKALRHVLSGGGSDRRIRVLRCRGPR